MNVGVAIKSIVHHRAARNSSLNPNSGVQCYSWTVVISGLACLSAPRVAYIEGFFPEDTQNYLKMYPVSFPCGSLHDIYRKKLYPFMVHPLTASSQVVS